MERRKGGRRKRGKKGLKLTLEKRIRNGKNGEKRKREREEGNKAQKCVVKK